MKKKAIMVKKGTAATTGLKAHIYVSFDEVQERKVFLKTIIKDGIVEGCYDNLSGYDYTLIANPPSTMELYAYFQNIKKMLPTIRYKIYAFGNEQLK